MKEIIIFNVAAESGGALSILEEYYRNAVTHEDKDIQWIFVLSKPELKQTSNVKILRFPWIKKSWLHRLYFDYMYAPSLVKRYKANEIISLQNLIVPRIKGVKQSVYVHQALPFVDYRFTFRQNKKSWIYQNIIGKIIIRSIKRADHIIVQTEWMKQTCIEKSGIPSCKIEVKSPQINIDISKFFQKTDRSLKTFFYPAGGSYYKNHRIIVEACEKLKNNGYDDFEVIFTLEGNENDHISDLYKIVKERKLQIKFVGNITRKEVFDYYSKSVLIFPSYIETFGLPILEAKLHRGIILASDCPFSREILSNYENAYFFDPFDNNHLYKIIKELKNSNF